MNSHLRVISGENTYAMSAKVRFYKEKFHEKYPEGNIVEIGENATLRNLVTHAQSQGLFSTKTLVIAQDFWRSETYDEAEKKDVMPVLESSDATFLFVQTTLDKRKKMTKWLLSDAFTQEAFPPLSESKLSAWAQHYATQKNLELPQKALHILQSACGIDQWKWQSEIDKMGILVSDGMPVLETLVGIKQANATTQIWNIVGAFSQKNVAKMMQELQILIQMGESAYMILPMLMREIRIHILIKSAQEKGFKGKEIASQVGMSPYVIQKTEKLSRQFSIEELNSYYRILKDIDIGSKTGEIQVSGGDEIELISRIESLFLALT